MTLKQPIAFLKKKELTIAKRKTVKSKKAKSKKMRGYTNLKMKFV